jgi:hypothetical protein
MKFCMDVGKVGILAIPRTSCLRKKVTVFKSFLSGVSDLKLSYENNFSTMQF